eukprot:TRINITY_DN97890_c0_g1_i1.p1 TRINITY_DN97890_c0_g1~~TRINITY_DN97890_c0_g1_i1.p1  ORF type:complete len:445 (+),score=116.96 TRINITY_DN97890_c0_g1_i1:70-1404(+)
MAVSNEDAVQKALSSLGGNAERRVQAVKSLEVLSKSPQDRSAIIAAGGAKLLVAQLARPGDQVPLTEKTRLANTLASLAANPTCCAVIVNAHAAAPLVKLLAGSLKAAQEAAAVTLKLLAPVDGSRDKLVEAGVVDALIAVLSTTTDADVRCRACELFTAVLAGTSPKERKPRAFAAAQAGAVPVLVPLLALREEHVVLAEASMCLSYIACDNFTRVLVAQAGAVPALAELMATSSPEVQAKALAAIAEIVRMDAMVVYEEVEPTEEEKQARAEFEAAEAEKAKRNAEIMAMLASVADTGVEIAPVAVPQDEEEEEVVEEEPPAEEEEKVYPPDMDEMLACGFLPPVVELLQGPTDEVKIEASHALFQLAARGDIQAKILDAGPLPALLALMEDGPSANCRAWAITCLRLLGTSLAIREAIERAVPPHIEPRDEFLKKLRKLCF